MLFESLAGDIVKQIKAQLKDDNAIVEDENIGKMQDFYENRQIDYLADDALGLIFTEGKYAGQWKVPPSTFNITRQIIKKISLVYKYAPERSFAEQKENTYDEWAGFYPRFNMALKGAERYKNLLHRILFRPVFDTGFKDVGGVQVPTGYHGWRFFVEHEYDVHFLEGDPLNPIAFSIPIKQNTESTEAADQEDQLWLFMSKDYYFVHNADGEPVGKYKDENERKNPFGILPLVEMRKESAVTQYAVSGAMDLVEANHAINVGMMDLSLMVHYQGHNQYWENSGLDAKEWKNIVAGASSVWHFPENSEAGVLNPTPKIAESIEAIDKARSLIKENYHIMVDYSGDKATPASGFSLIVQNTDLMEAREDDVEIAKVYEKEIYDIISAMQKVYSGKLPKGEPKLPEGQRLVVNFADIDFPVNQHEELEMRNWDIDHDIKTPLDYMDTDLNDDEKMELYLANKEINKTMSESDKIRDNIVALGGTVEE